MHLNFNKTISKLLKLIGILLFAVVATGCGTSTVKKGEQIALLSSQIVRKNHGSYVEYVNIGAINGKRQWPTHPEATIQPGPTSVLLFGKQTKMGAIYEEGDTYEFDAKSGRRYALNPGGIILSSDATQETGTYGKTPIHKTAILSKNIDKALIQSAVTLSGDDATKHTNKPMERLTYIHQYFGADDGYYSKSDIQLAREMVAGQRNSTGRIVGHNYLTVPYGRMISVGMKQCDNCKIVATYKLTPEKGKRYELSINGEIYVSDAYSDNIENRTIIEK